MNAYTDENRPPKKQSVNENEETKAQKRESTKIYIFHMYICIGNNNNKTKYSDYNTHIVYATNRLSQFYAPEFTHKISIG